MENPCKEIEICSCCGRNIVSNGTLAETMIDLAESVLYPRDVVINMSAVPEDKKNMITTEVICSRVALALRFYERRNRLMIPAVLENWDVNRMVRELY